MSASSAVTFMALARSNSLDSEEKALWAAAEGEDDICYGNREILREEYTDIARKFRGHAKRAREISLAMAKIGTTCKMMHTFVSKFARMPCRRAIRFVDRLRKSRQDLDTSIKKLYKMDVQDYEWREMVVSKEADHYWSICNSERASWYERHPKKIRKLIPYPFKAWEIHEEPRTRIPIHNPASEDRHISYRTRYSIT